MLEKKIKMKFIAEKGQSPVLHVLYIGDIEISNVGNGIYNTLLLFFIELIE